MKKTMVCLGFTCILTASSAFAQDGLTFTLANEIDMGSDCFSMGTLDDATDTIWALFEDCVESNYYLRGISIPDGTLVESDTFSEALIPLEDMYIVPETNPFAMVGDNLLEVRYTDFQTGEAFNLVLPEGAPPPNDTLLSQVGIEAIVGSYNGYIESTVYNRNHTLAAVIDLQEVYVIDLQTASLLFQIPITNPQYSVFPQFSYDGTQLYYAEFLDPEDFTNWQASLQVFSIPDGALVETYEVPSAFFWMNNDGTRMVYKVDDLESHGGYIGVHDLITGETTEVLPVFEPPSRPPTCTNTGRPTDPTLDLTRTGSLFVRNVLWLSDGSGFYTLVTHSGAAIGGTGSYCMFDSSRLRLYTIGS